MNDEEALWIYYELRVNQIKTEIKSRGKKKKTGLKLEYDFNGRKKSSRKQFTLPGRLDMDKRTDMKKPQKAFICPFPSYFLSAK